MNTHTTTLTFIYSHTYIHTRAQRACISTRHLTCTHTKNKETRLALTQYTVSFSAEDSGWLLRSFRQMPPTSVGTTWPVRNRKLAARAGPAKRRWCMFIYIYIYIYICIYIYIRTNISICVYV